MIICLIIGIILFIVGIVVSILFIKDYESELAICTMIIICLVCFILISPFVALDKASGTTLGTITSVDKNFFGTYTIYLKTTEQQEDKYCVEDINIVNRAKENIGNKVQLFYGERVGLYHLNECRTSPVDRIEVK